MVQRLSPRLLNVLSKYLVVQVDWPVRMIHLASWRNAMTVGVKKYNNYEERKKTTRRSEWSSRHLPAEIQ